MSVSTLSQPRVDAASPRLSHERRALPDGALTTVHVARFDRDAFALSVAAIEPCATLAEWCAASGAAHAIVGGFYMRPGGPALGDVWIDGAALPSEPFDAPWHSCRACVHAEAGGVALLAREEIEGPPRGDLLQAGPMLVREGELSVHPGIDAEGFSQAPASLTPTSAKGATRGRRSAWPDATWSRSSATGGPTTRRG